MGMPPMKTFLLLCALLACLPTFAGDDEVPFEEFGKTFLKTHFKAKAVTEVPLAKLHDEHTVHGTFGVFEIAYPTWAIGEKGRVEDLRSITTALLQLQEHWIDWLAKGKPGTEAPKANAETLIAWVKTWKPADFSKAETATDKDIFALLGANDGQKKAAAELGAYLLSPEVLGGPPKNAEKVHLLFAPTRLDFVHMIAYTGLLDPTQQAQLWTKQASTWTAFWLEWTLVLALEYPPWGDDKSFETGLSMNKYEATGMLEHTLQQSMLALLWMVYGDSDALYLNQAQAMNMVIEVVGEINALEGEGGRATTGGHTEPYEKFVPGGNSSGGFLPPISAAPQDQLKTNFWHEGLGKDHFLAPLRKGQVAGYKQLQKDNPHGLDPAMAKDHSSHFALTSATNGKKTVVTAPFFGEASKTKPYPPTDFIPDYREFFRAYKCAFYWWIQTQGDKAGAEASAAKYSKLLTTLVTRDPSKKIDDIIAEIYGVPLSGKNMDTDSLEWRFLEWIAKGK
jgi:hypothetical protein